MRMLKRKPDKDRFDILSNANYDMDNIHRAKQI
jgi:hypothetical protein